MMLSKKDKMILNYIDEHGSITINQCAKVVFTGNKYANDQARKKLRNLYNEKAIARYRNSVSNESIYYIDTRLNIHALKLLDIYAELIAMGAKIESFCKKYRVYTGGKKYREIDALIELYYDDYFIPLIVEIDYSHNTSIAKLQEIYKSNHFQNKYQELSEDIFPSIVICRPVVKKSLVVESDFQILYTDFALQNLGQVLN